MAVYKKTYRPYDGELTSSWKRLMVIPRYAFEDLNRSRFLTIFFLASLIYPLISALIIYVRHNASVLSLLGAPGCEKFISIGVGFFMGILGWQSMLALFLASFIGPGLVSPDLANNALALYLARPFSRVEYVIGKMLVLVVLLSAMTWIPALPAAAARRRSSSTLSAVAAAASAASAIATSDSGYWDVRAHSATPPATISRRGHAALKRIATAISASGAGFAATT